MLPNQKRALEIAREAIEVDSFDTLGFYEFFDDEELTHEDVKEIQGYIQELSISIPASWRIHD